MTQFGGNGFREQKHDPSREVHLVYSLEIRKKVIVNRVGTDLCDGGALVLVGRSEGLPEEPTPIPSVFEDLRAALPRTGRLPDDGPHENSRSGHAGSRGRLDRFCRAGCCRVRAAQARPLGLLEPSICAEYGKIPKILGI